MLAKKISIYYNKRKLPERGITNMFQAYQGYFCEKMRFYSDNKEVKIPTNKRIVINILDDDTDFSKDPQIVEFKRMHVPLKERIKDFSGDYEFEEWDTGVAVGIEVTE